jgi:hypothetical protein
MSRGLHYDEYQFANKRNRPVSKDSGLSYEDYRSMGTDAPRSLNRFAVPQWTLSDEKARVVIAARISRYGHGGTPCSIESVPKDLASLRVAEIGAMEHLRLLAKRSLASRIHLQAMEKSGGLATFYAALIYRAYRLGKRSTELAVDFGMMPTQIRAAMVRLNKIARHFFPDDCCAPSKLAGRKYSGAEKRHRTIARRKALERNGTTQCATLCGYCHKRPPCKGGTRCEICRAKNREKMARWLKAHPRNRRRIISAHPARR